MERGPHWVSHSRDWLGVDNLLGSSGVPGSWCWVVRGKLPFSNDLWRKAGHSVYRTQVTEIKRLTMNLREQPPGTPEEPPPFISLLRIVCCHIDSVQIPRARFDHTRTIIIDVQFDPPLEVQAMTNQGSPKSENEVIKILATLLEEASNHTPETIESFESGACVYTAGSGTYCANLSKDQCDALGGVWTPGSTCSSLNNAMDSPSFVYHHNSSGARFLEMLVKVDALWMQFIEVEMDGGLLGSWSGNNTQTIADHISVPPGPHVFIVTCKHEAPGKPREPNIYWPRVIFGGGGGARTAYVHSKDRPNPDKFQFYKNAVVGWAWW